LALELAESAVPAARLALRQGFVLTRAQAIAVGLGPPEQRRLLHRGTWSQPRRGILSVLPAGHPGAPETGATAAALARPGSVITHESAAILHGLPVLTPPARPILTSDARHWGGTDAALIRAASVPAAHRQSWYGAPLSSVARTIFDVSRASGAAAGLVVADAALAESLCTRSAVQDLCAFGEGWPGVGAARQVAELMNHLSESPLESITRLCLADGGLPPPELQARVRTERGRYRVDMLWSRERVIVEADGAVKYRDDSALWREKRRQEDLEQAGYRVVRVTWADVTADPERTVRRVRAALASGSV
jgi:hypothetical protein